MDMKTWQVAKRVMLILDMSESMHYGGAVEAGKQAVLTILRTLTPQDSVNVHLISGSSPGLPKHIETTGLLPATPNNIARLSEWVRRATVMGRKLLYPALNEALKHLNVVKPCQNCETSDTGAERIEEDIHHYVFLISDGTVLRNDFGRKGVDSVYASIKDEHRNRTHVVGVAVGKLYKETQLREISCKLNGIFLIVSEDRGPSAMRTSLSKWYQMLAVPLAALLRSGKLSATWTRPVLDRSKQEVHMTVALPCFVDLELAQPESIGAVSLDVALSGKGAGVWRTLLPMLNGLLRPSSAAGFAAIKKGLQVSIVMRGHSNQGIALFNSQLSAQYTLGANHASEDTEDAPVGASRKFGQSDSDSSSEQMLHALETAYADDVFGSEGLLDKVLATSKGYSSTMARPLSTAGLRNFGNWDFAPDRSSAAAAFLYSACLTSGSTTQTARRQMYE
jgi:hypothetical protein